eukprot:2654702-Lingulodinium_polyedra.AAC.1
MRTPPCRYYAKQVTLAGASAGSALGDTQRKNNWLSRAATKGAYRLSLARAGWDAQRKDSPLNPTRPATPQPRP